jgi:hypothetical protein
VGILNGGDFERWGFCTVGILNGGDFETVGILKQWGFQSGDFEKIPLSLCVREHSQLAHVSHVYRGVDLEQR